MRAVISFQFYLHGGCTHLVLAVTRAAFPVESSALPSDTSVIFQLKGNSRHREEEQD